jgi:predicted nucleic acid-binding protein
MTTVFADTSYYVALLNSRDGHHAAAYDFTERFGGEFLTTAWVLVEVANFLARAPNRSLFLSLHADLRSDSRVTIIPPSQELLDRGIELYSERLDKDWSLTDCISFLVMQDRELQDALTSDHHFQQAGFSVLLT